MLFSCSVGYRANASELLFGRFLTHKDATSRIRAAEKRSSRQLVNSGRDSEEHPVFETTITFMWYDEASGGIAGRALDHAFHECLLYFFPPPFRSYLMEQVSRKTPSRKLGE